MHFQVSLQIQNSHHDFLFVHGENPAPNNKGFQHYSIHGILKLDSGQFIATVHWFGSRVVIGMFKDESAAKIGYESSNKIMFVEET